MRNIVVGSRVDSRTLVAPTGNFSDAVRTNVHCKRLRQANPGQGGSSGSIQGGSSGSIDSEPPQVLQFTCPIYFVETEEGKLSVDIMRLGNMKGTVSAQWRTVDGSAKAPERYTAATGEIVFPEGVSQQTIEIEVERHPSWAATLEFQLELENPEGCELGRYLHICRVKIIDNECFPSDKYRELILEGKDGIERISDFGLFLQFAKLTFRHNEIGWRSALAILMDQLSNAYRLLVLWLGIYMVDTLFNTQEESSEARLLLSDRETTAFLVAVLFALPFILLHVWEIIKGKLDIGGRTRVFLQTNLFRRYLNYSEEVRREVPVALIQSAIVTDCADLAEGYLAAINILLVAGKLAVLTGFTLYSNPSASWVPVAMASLLLVFACWRNKYLQEADDVVGDNEVELMRIIQDTAQHYSLVAHYAQRPRANHRFAKQAEQLRCAEIPCSNIQTNNNYAAKWLGPLFTCVYIIIEAKTVLSPDPSVSLGAFLATVSIFGQISGDFGELYKEVMLIVRIIGSLKGLTCLLNKPTDLKSWKRVNRERRVKTAEVREQVLRANSKESPQAGKYLTDTIPLKVIGMGFSHDSGSVLFRSVDFNVNQGSLVAIVGDHGVGKTTLLRLLGHVVFPTEGQIFIPTHLRILHVGQEPQMMAMSVWKNLTFGRPNPMDTDPDRVEMICKRLGMDKTLKMIEEDLWNHPKAVQRRTMGYSVSKSLSRISKASGSVKLSEESSDEDNPSTALLCSCADDGAAVAEPEDEDDGSWAENLPYSEKCRIHFARAMIMNPEVLVLQRPLFHFSPHDKTNILQILKEHVENRGFCMPAQSALSRRPRTVFYSTESVEHCRAADHVWQIAKNVTDPRAGSISTVSSIEPPGEAQQKCWSCNALNPISRC